MNQIDHSLFDAHAHALETQEQCPECGALLHLRRSKKGLFLGCSAYPSCSYLLPLSEQEQVIQKVLDQPCPECEKSLALKKGRFGLFIGCTGFPECHYHARLDEPTETGVVCPECNKGHLVERISRYGKHFYACDSFPRCKYAVNGRPVVQTCVNCGWPLVIEKKVSGQIRLVCPQKNCGHKQPQ